MEGFRLICFLTVLALCVQLASFQKRLNEGDACKLRNKKKGICRPFPNCQSALNDLSANQRWPTICRHSGTTSIVCCDEEQSGGSESVSQEQPFDSSSTTTTTTTPATTTKRTTRPSSVRRPIPGIVSRLKCEEYSRWLAGPPTLFGTSDSGDNRRPGRCGVNVATFIHGGTEAEPLEFPHMAHLGFGYNFEDLSWSCGGSLISENFVVTAAHCLRKKDGTNVTHVRLGSSDPRSKEVIRISEIFPHPEYSVNTLYNDIALLKLEREVKFDDYKRPACIQVNRNFRNTHGTASGWGATEDSKSSKKLLKVDLPFMTVEECSQTYKTNIVKLTKGIDDKTQICAGALDLKKDTCQGDSGGPLQIAIKNPACMYSIVGITSFGIRCGIAPGVYTRVSGFIPWVESTVWPGESSGNIPLD